MTDVDYHPSTHPPLPPTTEDERLSWLRLLRSRRVGIATFYRLLADHGTGSAALEALPEIAAEAGVTNYEPFPEKAALAELRAGRKAGAQLICLGASAYPAALLDADDPPPMLWIHGDPAVLARPMIGMVGARNASSLGLRMARVMAGELAEAGFVVVSGLARGIDAAAHAGAVGTGTVAVMAGGTDVLYPAENADLAADIAKTGVRLSEMPMGQQPQARHFPRRNRIISALGQALVVVEAAARSGSLITARTALDQGREVLAVPGHPFDARASGCNMLIRDGAGLVRSAADVIEALPKSTPAKVLQGEFELPASPPADQRAFRETARLHNEILNRLSPVPLAEDQLIRDLSRDSTRVSPAITRLELLGRIRRHAGGLLARAGGD